MLVPNLRSGDLVRGGTNEINEINETIESEQAPPGLIPRVLEAWGVRESVSGRAGWPRPGWREVATRSQDAITQLRSSA